MSPSEDLFKLTNDIINGTISPADGLSNVKQLNEKDNGMSSRLIDVLVVLQSEADSDEKKQRYNEFAKGLKDIIIPTDILTLELEGQQEIHKKAIIRHKTRLYFKQSKFNLLREESEGYAKLITELLEVGTNDTSPEAMKSRVLCLIGQFNLDPNRVLTVLLQCFECTPKHKNYFINLIKEMSPNSDHLRDLIGFQFSLYQAEGKMTPFSLYTLVAYLVQAEMLNLMDITAYLKPNAEGIKSTHRLRSSNANLRAKKAETIITTQIAAESGRNNRDLDRDGSESQNIVGVSFAAVAATQDAEDDKLLGELSEEATLSTNQKLGLVCALLETGQWTLAQYLIDRLPEFYAVQSGPRICRAIAGLIDEAIDGFYREKCSSRLLFSNNVQTSKSGPLPRVESWNDIAENIAPVLWYLGPRIGYSSNTATKLIRLLVIFFEERKSSPSTSDDKVANTMMDIVDECLLSSLSLQVNTSNVALSEELWNLLQLMPYQQRYRLYGRWKFTHSTRHPELIVNKAKVLGRTKYVLKRLSKETVKIMGRQLGKLCHVHPITVIDYMLTMVQTFDNFIGPVVESLKFLTLLEFDVLSFCLIEQLANPDRLQLKASDGNLSMWLQALGTMVGSIYKKYNVELAGILNYVANQLKNNKGFDLLILREIIQNMSSIESSINATEEQLDALTGGEILRMEAGGFSTARNKRASIRLKDALMEDDIAFGLCVLIAQQREFIIHRESEHLPLKLIGEMVDQCRDTLVQFGTFLMQNLKYEDYCKRIPSAAVLIEECGLPLDVSMFLTRTFFSHLISEAYGESKKVRRSLDTDTSKRMDNQQKFIFFKSAMDDVIQKFATELGSVEMLKQSKNVQVIGMKMLVTFWMLSSYDIETPTGAYDKAIETIRRQSKEVETSPDMSKSKKAKDIERLATLEARLKEEQRRQADHVERVRMWLNASQEELFLEKGSASIPFLATCVLKRALFSESDAIFCAKLVLLLNAQKTTYFQTMIFFDKTFADLLPFITGLTENEASAFGRFLEILLNQANKWNLNKEVFEKECYLFPGFHLKIGSKTSQEAISHALYKSLTWKWQLRSCKSFVTALQSPKSDYVVIRNCFIILAKMITCFPIINDHHSQMEKATTELQKREKGKRDDLALLASSYAARLKSIRKTLVDKSVYSGRAEKPKPETKSAATPNGATEKGDKRKSEAAPSESKKRPRTERAKEGEALAEKKNNGVSSKANSQNVAPLKEEKLRESIEDGEVSPDHSSAKKPRSSSQNGKDVKEEVRMEKTPRSTRKRDENGEKKEVKTEKREIKPESRRVVVKEEKKDDRKKEEEVRRRKEVPKEAEVAGPELPPALKDPKEERKEKREEARLEKLKEIEKKEVEKLHRREVRSELDVDKREKKPDLRKEEKIKHEKDEKEERLKEKLLRSREESKKEERHKEERKELKVEVKEEKKEERLREDSRKRISSIDRPDRDEPGVKISRTLSSGRATKGDLKQTEIAPAVRKHRPISPPKDFASRRGSAKEPQRATFRR